MLLRHQVENLLKTALSEAQNNGLLPKVAINGLEVKQSQSTDHGDFACSVALKLSGSMKMHPMKIAEKIVSLVPTEMPIEKIWVAKPGFINLSLDTNWIIRQVDVIRNDGERYGNQKTDMDTKIQIEFVSVNPTGPLHVGHARGAVFGSAVAEILKAAGYEVEREYYFNDAGSQMDRFRKSLYARYLQIIGEQASIPTDGYHGQYMIDLAQDICNQEGDRYLNITEQKALSELGTIGLKRMTELAQSDMHDLRVHYDNWFKESSLFTGGQFGLTVKLLLNNGHLEDREGATWFKASALGDDEDKVFVRSSGEPTYFATDVAYHYDKFIRRKYDRVINVLGADHQGHARFMKIVPKALGISTNRLDMIIYQLVSLKRGNETVRASKRTGDIITLRELLEEVGTDACRYFFLSRSAESQIEFDLDLAKKQSSDNPVFYIQYAHARTCSILRHGVERNIDYSNGDLSFLQHNAELALIKKMVELPDLIDFMARTLEPHHLPHYAIELSTSFHTFYEQCRVISESPMDINVSKARLKLVEAAKIILSKCLSLMLMDTPEQM